MSELRKEHILAAVHQGAFLLVVDSPVAAVVVVAVAVGNFQLTQCTLTFKTTYLSVKTHKNTLNVPSFLWLLITNLG